MIDFLMNIDGKVIYILLTALILSDIYRLYSRNNKLRDLVIRQSGLIIELSGCVESLETRIKDLESHGK